MSTKRELFIAKYTEIKNQLAEIFVDRKDFLPELIDMPLADLIVLIDAIFYDDNTKDNLRNIIDMKGFKCSDDEFEKLLNTVEDFLKWYRNFRN